MKTLTRLGVAISAAEPHGTAPVSFVRILVGKPLNDREVLLVPSERFETEREGVIRAGLFDVWEPGFRRNSPAESEEYKPFWRGDRSRSGGKPAEAKGFKEGQRDQSGAGTKKLPTSEMSVHGDCSFGGYFV